MKVPAIHVGYSVDVQDLIRIFLGKPRRGRGSAGGLKRFDHEVRMTGVGPGVKKCPAKIIRQPFFMDRAGDL